MAYKNVWLPYGEERVFDLPGWGKEKYGSFTIDEDKDAVLLKGTVDKDNPSEKPFFFYFKGKIVRLFMNCDERVDDSTVKWKIVGFDIPDSLDRDEVFAELRKAFTVYGVNGMSEEEQKRWKVRYGKSHPNGFAVTDF